MFTVPEPNNYMETFLDYSRFIGIVDVFERKVSKAKEKDGRELFDKRLFSVSQLLIAHDALFIHSCVTKKVATLHPIVGVFEN